MSPLTIYTDEGLPKVPAGPAGPQGVQGIKGDTGPTGPTGPMGPPAPVRRYWRLFGDNSGDSVNNVNTVWSTVKSPVFTAPADGWYKVVANFSITGAVQAAVSVMVGANVGQMFYAGAVTEHQLISITIPLQLTAGQKVTVGFRPIAANKPVTMVNSNTVVPMLLIEEVAAPS